MIDPGSAADVEAATIEIINPAHPRGDFRAAVFDFDGTLADSFAAITASVNHVCRAYGLPDDWTEAQIRPRVGYGLVHLMEELFPGHDPQRSVAVYREHHPSVMRSGTRLLPGAADTVAELRRRGQREGHDEAGTD